VTDATSPAHTTEPATKASDLPYQPAVSVILPVLNEERHLADAVRMVLSQDYPALIEVILALGPSKDRTDEVAAELASGDVRVRTVLNPSGRTPDALNAAIAAATGDVIVRVDGHAEIPADYVSTAVRELIRVGADNVGGIMDAQGTTDFERAVARAMRSKIGVGNSAFHTGGDAGESETVYLGVFRRTALERIGGYDPHFARAQDWEMNHRIRESGGKVWFTPELKVTYRPRGTLKALATQYFHYGRWRRVVVRHHAGTLNLRYLAPPAMVLGTTATLVGGFLWTPAWLVPAGYVAAVTVGGIAIGRGESLQTRVLAPIVLSTMHWAWGIGFLSSPRRLAAGGMRGGMPIPE
jgi:hypothetical protein